MYPATMSDMSSVAAVIIWASSACRASSLSSQSVGDEDVSEVPAAGGDPVAEFMELTRGSLEYGTPADGTQHLAKEIKA
jgi:hypothetical protein